MFSFHEFDKVFDQINKIISLIDFFLRFGGSNRLGECLTVSKLNSYFDNNNEKFNIIDINKYYEVENISENEIDKSCIIWSKRQKNLLSFYVNGLIASLNLKLINE